MKQGDPSRRDFLRTASAAAFVCGAHAVAPHAHAQEMPSLYEKGWYYPIEEMKAVYEREYSGERPFRMPVIRENGILIGSYKGHHFVVAPQFVDQLLRQITEMLASGAATYIFRLDAYHGHLFVAPEVYRERYEGRFALPKEFVNGLETTVADADLRVLHHTYEHLTSPKPGDSMHEKYSRRNVVGFFNGTKNESLPLPPPPKTACVEPGPARVPNFVYAAHKDGLFSIKHPHTGEEIRIDISFEDWQWYR